ncbi:vanadium-dependent haloperoxidase [Mucilaginibacter agri]|uniref:Phosphatase PAP2 family protein n=1 Tax=Mucilaginibacter agri TaxID=2695265 RepID=A0A965ZMN1_9SPHI|nr:vanadium-dependent haloperoxidase [Mucilaginibacter agri]NCD72511.1 phosphatase PAP2 family protein [Mucilaginibacter agri]
MMLNKLLVYQFLLFTCFFAASALLTSCTENDYQKVFNDPALYSRTVHELNTVVMGNNFTPVVASRNYAYATVAGYEVIAAGDSKHYRSLAGQLNQLKTLPKPNSTQKICFPYAALWAFCKVGEAVTFPAGSLKYYTDSLHTVAKMHGMPSEMVSASEAYADTIATSIIKWSKGDNYLHTRSAPKFTVKDSAGRWTPTPPAYADAAEPHWGEIRTMVMHNAREYDAPPPPAFNITDKNSMYYREVMLIKSTGDSLNKEQSWTADFWDDNPQKLNIQGHVQFITKKFSPPGHWLSIVGIGAKQINADFNTTVAAYAKTAVALFDAFIESWTAKYVYKTIRPESVINKYVDREWRPHLQTPPFPEYTCGHCTISAAAAEALTSALGDNIAYKDTSELEFGIDSRSFKSFKAAAEETARSRFYGGIHFQNSCNVSRLYGKKVGDSVAVKLVMKR